MLPTPAKTPRKKTVHSGTLDATARILFPAWAVNHEDALPRVRKGRRQGGFTLQSLAEEEEDSAGIQIYTDSVDRMPEVDESGDNPFVVRKDVRRSARGGRTQSSVAATKYGISKEVDEAVDNGEGIVYVL